MEAKIHPNIQRDNHSFYHIKDTEMLDIMPFECGRELCDAGKPRICVAYNYYAFHVVLSGRGQYRVNGILHNISKNQIFCFFPGEPIEYAPDPQDPWEYYWVNFVGVKAQAFVQMCQFSKENPVYTFDDDRIIPLFHKIVTQENRLTRDILAISSLYEIFALIIEARCADFEPPPKKKNIDDAIRYISDNYIKPNLSLKEVAQTLGYDPKYFSHLFKKNVGISFVKYVNRIRIMKACEYIEKTEMSFKEIATMCGFSNPLYFSRRFDELILSPPSVYREMIGKKKTNGK